MKRVGSLRRAVAPIVSTVLVGSVLAVPTPAAGAAVGAALPAVGPVGQGFSLNRSDLRFILKQIKISEEHVRTRTASDPCGTLLGAGPNQIANQNNQGVELPWGLRTVDGSCNNLVPSRSQFGASDESFSRMTQPYWRPGYEQPGTTSDPEPRRISNLISDQTEGNDAAVVAGGAGADIDPASGTVDIPNVAPDVGLSAPYNSLFTIFGQFFDHGLDLTNKGPGKVFMPLDSEDPLYKTGAPTNFMVLTRATATSATQRDAVNKTTPFVDQSQTYGSHPSHQVFLREYTADVAGKPDSTGSLLTGGAGGGLATWAAVKAQSASLLGIKLTDVDVTDVPLLATDPYGQFEPGPNGYPQIVTGSGLVEGDPTANGGTGIGIPADATKTRHAFLDDIARHAVPIGDKDPTDGPGPYVPLDRDTDPGTTDDRDPATYDDEMLDEHFIAGDGRLNENIALSAVHHVFHSEHNRLVADIDRIINTEETAANVAAWNDTSYPGAWTYGERLFQAARFVTEMEYQHLAFEDFARKVQPQVNAFTGYDTTIDPAITAEFAHAVYRFGHSMLTETVARTKPGGARRDIPLLDAFLNPPAYDEGGLTPDQAAGDIMRGMSKQVGSEMDEFVTEALRNRLLGLPLDLAALNLARGRDTGMPPLNETRRQFFAATNNNSALRPYSSWLDFGDGLRHHESLINFVAAYGTHPSITGGKNAKRAAAALLVAGNPSDPETPTDSVDFMNSTGSWSSTETGLDLVDLWVGGLAERQAPFGGLLGSTFNYVFEKQMENLQDGDRFYYLARTAGLNLLTQLEGNSASELIERNTDVTDLPADAFSRPDLFFYLENLGTSGPVPDDPTTPWDESVELRRTPDGTLRYSGTQHVVFIGTPTADRMRSSEGDDTLRGNADNDTIEGGAGNDTLIGGDGRDIMTDSFGDDVTKGGDGHDAINSGAGFDLNQPGRGDDFTVGGSDLTETIAGPGDDMVYAGDAADTVFGDDGDDWIEGGNQADLLQGDNGAPFQDDLNEAGHDVIIGGAGADDYDSEGGDDIMVAGPGVERNEGMLGFDWVNHQGHLVAADADLARTAFVVPAVDTLSDRFDEVESLSGWKYDDTLFGDDQTTVDRGGDTLTAEGIARIEGLQEFLGAEVTSYDAGNILLGGGGSDVIEGRGGDDIIDGDLWLSVSLPAPDLSTPDPDDTKLFTEMSQLQADVFAGRIDGGQISVVRQIVPPAGVDTGADAAVFSGPRADYDIVAVGAKLEVTHARGTATDGVDRVSGVEELRFSDRSVSTAVTAPGVPTAADAVAGDASATVTYSAPTSDGGSPITEYRVQVFTGSTLENTVSGIAPDARRAEITGLTNGTSYTFRVIAVNSAGASGASEPTFPVTPQAAAEPATRPGAPTIGTASGGDGQATVRWAAPTDDGATPITEYRIQVRTGTVVVRTVTGVPAAATDAVVTGLTNGTAYNFRVRAVNAVGVGVLSAPSNAVTPTGAAAATVPGQPAIGRADPGAAGGAITATANWPEATNDGGSPITGYRVRALRLSSTGAVLGSTTSPVQPASSRALEMTLPVAGDYRFMVQAINDVGTSTWSRRSNPVAGQ
ncbi:MAG: fibronectin type III domain-containing protein [Nocardioidaceae bacterium]|nr:fibronectin type III domain-containing protein [Nocardioidaceae bacterium]